METMGLYIGAGLAMMGVLGWGMGIGLATKWLLEAISSNPEKEESYMKWGMLWMALAEATSMYALAVALMLLFLMK